MSDFPDMDGVNIDPSLDELHGEVLAAAYKLCTGERNRTYGPFPIDYARVVTAFNAITGYNLTPAEGIMFMVCIKLVRAQTGYDAGLPAEELLDNPVDGAAYLGGWYQTVAWERTDWPDDGDDGTGDETPVPDPDPSVAL